MGTHLQHNTMGAHLLFFHNYFCHGTKEYIAWYKGIYIFPT